MFIDGQRVSYVGLDAERIGDHGRVLQGEQGGAHILWQTGARKNQIDWTEDMDLAPLGRVEAARDALDDSLEYGGMQSHGVRQAMDDGGEVAVLNYMSEHGRLAAFRGIAEEALQFITSRIRQDEAIQQVATQLEDDEAEALIALASHVLVRDAFIDED